MKIFKHILSHNNLLAVIIIKSIIATACGSTENAQYHNAPLMNGPKRNEQQQQFSPLPPPPPPPPPRSTTSQDTNRADNEDKIVSLEQAASGDDGVGGNDNVNGRKHEPIEVKEISQSQFQKQRSISARGMMPPPPPPPMDGTKPDGMKQGIDSKQSLDKRKFDQPLQEHKQEQVQPPPPPPVSAIHNEDKPVQPQPDTKQYDLHRIPPPPPGADGQRRGSIADQDPQYEVRMRKQVIFPDSTEEVIIQDRQQLPQHQQHQQLRQYNDPRQRQDWRNDQQQRRHQQQLTPRGGPPPQHHADQHPQNQQHRMPPTARPYPRGPPPPHQQRSQQGRIPPHHQQQYQRHRQQQQQGQGQGQGQLMPYNHQQQQQQKNQPLRSIFSKLNQSIDALADVDTILTQRTKSLAGSVSSVMRRKVIDVSEGVTGLRDNIKDGVGGVRAVFGGAPTSSTESQDEWEDDRRMTASQLRQKKILNWNRGILNGESKEKEEQKEEGSSSHDGSGDPLQDHLNSLMETEIETEESDDDWDETVADKYQQPIDGDDGRYNEDDTDFIPDSDVEEHEEMDFHHDHDGDDDERAFSSEVGDTGGVDEGDRPPGASKKSPSTPEDDDIIDPSTFFGGGNVARSSQPRKPSVEQNYDDDLEDDSILDKVKNVAMSAIPRVPSMKVPSFGRKSFDSNGMGDSGWPDDDEDDSIHRLSTKQSRPSPSLIPRVGSKMVIPQSGRSGMLSVTDLLQRRATASVAFKRGSGNLLSPSEVKQCTQIGKGKGIMDVLALVFSIVFLEEMKQTEVMQSWAPHALASAILSLWTSHVLFDTKEQKLSQQVGNMIKSRVVDAQMYLRLQSGQSIKPTEADSLSNSGKKQILAAVEISRFRSFVSLVVTGLILFTVAVIKPLTSLVLTTLTQLVSLDTLRSWPIEWGTLLTDAKDLIIPQLQSIGHLLQGELDGFLENPIMILSQAFPFLALMSISFIPLIERGRLSSLKELSRNANKIQEATFANNASFISNMGMSSSNRLFLQNRKGLIEKSLTQWKMMLRRQSGMRFSSTQASKGLAIRNLSYTIFCSFFIFIPFILFIDGRVDGPLSSSIFNSFVPHDNSLQLLHTTLMLLFASKIVGDVIVRMFDLISDAPHVTSFLASLAGTVDEVTSSEQSQKGQLQMPTTSANDGIVVTDLWAAHTARRGWACKGTHILCKNGEVVIILGDDASGKSRFLAAISEKVISPPRRSRTTTLARGTISISGANVDKWDKTLLKRKVGVLLNGAGSLTDVSRLYSGLTLNEILEPVDTKAIAPSISRSTLDMASQLTGLSKTLLPRLEDKFTTIVTANEEALTLSTGAAAPKNLQQQPQVLSSSEWSKVILTKVIAQAMFSNDNPMSSPDTLSKCLQGSILLLDDAAVYMDEIEEASLIKNLRSSGASTVMTTNHWATGRFADRIFVMKNGSVVESGTHMELLAKGPQRSVYAAKWSSLTKQ